MEGNMPDGAFLNAFTTAAQPTLQDVFDAIGADEGLTPQRCRNLLSAIRSLGKLMGRDLGVLPAHPRFYRDLFKDLHPEHCENAGAIIPH